LMTLKGACLDWNFELNADSAAAEACMATFQLQERKIAWRLTFSSLVCSCEVSMGIRLWCLMVVVTHCSGKFGVTSKWILAACPQPVRSHVLTDG
jgi:hypothetical protein